MPQRILNFLERLYQLQTLNQLTEIVCAHLPELIGGDNAIVCSHNGHTRTLYSVAAQRPFSCKYLLPNVNVDHLVAQHPFWEHVLQQEHAIRILSDLTSENAWHDNPIYREVYRYDNVEDQINTEIFGTMDCFTTVGVLRSRRGFSDRDRTTFTQLRPHLIQAFTNARMAETAGLVQGWNENAWAHPVTPDGKLHHTDETTRKSLALRYQRGGRLPESVETWIRLQSEKLNLGFLDTRIEPLLYTDREKIWRFTLHNRLEQDSFMLCCQLVNTPTKLQPLSPRESEILRWVNEGKSNSEIAAILDLSLHTVKDHLKNAFRKLGVENRIAAGNVWKNRSLEEISTLQ